MKYIIIFLAALVLAACIKEPLKTDSTDNVNVPVSLLFTHDGCNVYRFSDGGHSHYYTDCRGSTNEAHTETCGKNCVTEEYDTIQTVR